MPKNASMQQQPNENLITADVITASCSTMKLRRLWMLTKSDDDGHVVMVFVPEDAVTAGSPMRHSLITSQETGK